MAGGGRKGSSFMLTKSKSFYIKQFRTYLKENWINLVVLGLVLSLSAASSGIIYAYATESITDVSNEMLLATLNDIKNRVATYLTLSISTVPAAKNFLASRTIGTGPNMTAAGIIDATKAWGYFFNASASFANSLFYMDYLGNDLGWGGGKSNSIVLYWPSIIPGFNIYAPVNGAIGNLSTPIVSNNITLVFPPLDIARQTRKPYWESIFLLRLDADDVRPLLTYVEPAYYDDTGDFCCIVGANIYVRAFETVLASYQIGKNAKVFIADSKGTLMADSTNGLDIYLNDNEAPLSFKTLPNITENEDPTIARAAKFLIGKYGSFEDIPDQDQFFYFNYKGSKQILLVGQYARDNLKIYIGIVVPYSTFFAGIDTSRHITISLTVIAVVCGVLRYLFAWRIIARKKGKGSSIVAPTSTDSTSTVSSTVSISVTALPASRDSSREGSSAALVSEPTKTPVSYFSP